MHVHLKHQQEKKLKRLHDWLKCIKNDKMMHKMSTLNACANKTSAGKKAKKVDRLKCIKKDKVDKVMHKIST